jgi:probable UDP-sugar transporter A4
MMFIYVSISGLAGVYTEFILKSNIKDPIFMQNTYLYIYSSAFNLFGYFTEVLATQKKVDKSNESLFNDFNKFTWLIIATQVYNGLCMSVIMKYSNNITKLFVISCSLLVTTVLSVVLFSVHLNAYFYCVALVTLLAIYFYFYEDFNNK